ncbi:MAG: CYTH domain-containing protein [Candidatus Zipacnadales bacterium]
MMATEVERRFRVLTLDPAYLGEGRHIRQGYLCYEPTVRVRIEGQCASLTIKGRGLHARSEFEYSIPLQDAEILLQMCEAIIQKKRFTVGRIEIDVFEGALEGLVIAEVEGATPEESITSPSWLTWVEVTGLAAYANTNLARYGIPPYPSLSPGSEPL